MLGNPVRPRNRITGLSLPPLQLGTMQASIFYTVLGDIDQRAATTAALESANGAIRSALGRELGLRITPTLAFFEDGLPESAKALDSLLSKVHELDAEVAALRANATYAGGEDPYKAPRVIDED